MMIGAEDVTAHLHAALHAAVQDEAPFRHWTLADVLPRAACDAVRALPFVAPDMAAIAGRRENINAQRRFFGVESCARHPVCAAIAAAFQAPATVDLLEARCATRLAGGFLRIEYCQDAAGFWLEPHTDIGAKLFTMLVYLSEGEQAASWGTDLLDDAHRLVARASGAFNSGLIFIPAANTWHGFAPRPIEGVRRTLIVNYVTGEWNSRHELSFPQTPVGGGNSRLW